MNAFGEGSETLNESAYAPGALSQIVGLHMRYYAPAWGFGLPFETKLAVEIGGFLQRYDPERDLFLCVWRGDCLMGSITLDGGDIENGLSHLRWFIVSDAARGTGLGGKLIAQAVHFAREKNHDGIFLTTFSGLDAARHLYEKAGFKLVNESDIDQWGGGVREQRFELRF